MGGGGYDGAGGGRAGPLVRGCVAAYTDFFSKINKIATSAFPKRYGPAITLVVSNILNIARSEHDNQPTQAGSSKYYQLHPRRMLLAISSQRVNVWYHTDPHDQWKRVTCGLFFIFYGLGLFLGANLVSTNEGLHILYYFSGVFKGRRVKLSSHVLHEPLGGTLEGMYVEVLRKLSKF